MNKEDTSNKKSPPIKRPADNRDTGSLEDRRLKLVAGNLAMFGLGELCENVAEGVHCVVHAAAVLSGVATVGLPNHLFPKCIGQSQFGLTVLNPGQSPVDWFALFLETLRGAQSAHQAVSELYDPEQLREAATLATLEQRVDLPAVKPSKAEIYRRIHLGAFIKSGLPGGLSPEWDDMALLEHDFRLQKLLQPTILVEGDSLLAVADLIPDTHLNEPLIYLRGLQRGKLSPRELYQLIRGHTLPQRRGQRFPVTVRAGVFLEVEEETAIEWSRSAEGEALAREMVYLNSLSNSLGADYSIEESTSAFSFPREFERAVWAVLSRRYSGESHLPTDPEIWSLGKEQYQKFCKWLKSRFSPVRADCPGHRLLYLSIFHLIVELVEGSVGTVVNNRLHLLAYEIARLAVLESAREKSRLQKQAKRSEILSDCLRLLSKLSLDEGLSHREIQRKHNKLPKPKLQFLLESLQDTGLITELKGKVYLTDENIDVGKVAELLGVPGRAPAGLHRKGESTDE